MPRDPEGSAPRDEVVFCRREPGPIFVSGSVDKRKDVVSACSISGFIALKFRSISPHTRGTVESFILPNVIAIYATAIFNNYI